MKIHLEERSRTATVRVLLVLRCFFEYFVGGFGRIWELSDYIFLHAKILLHYIIPNFDRCGEQQLSGQQADCSR